MMTEAAASVATMVDTPFLHYKREDLSTRWSSLVPTPSLSPGYEVHGTIATCACSGY